MDTSGATKIVLICFLFCLFCFDVEAQDSSYKFTLNEKSNIQNEWKHSKSTVSRYLSVCLFKKSSNIVLSFLQHIAGCHRKWKRLKTIKEGLLLRAHPQFDSPPSADLNNTLIELNMPLNTSHKSSLQGSIPSNSTYQQYAGSQLPKSIRTNILRIRRQVAQEKQGSNMDIGASQQDLPPSLLQEQASSIYNTAPIYYIANTPSSVHEVNMTTPASLVNSTQLYFPRHRRRRNREEARWAMVCMGGLVLLLFAVVLYSRMWKGRHSGWDYLYVAGSLSEEDLEGETIKFFSFKALIKAKTQYLADQIKKGADKFKKHRKMLQKKKGNYTKLEPIGEQSCSDSEDEIYNGTLHNV